MNGHAILETKFTRIGARLKLSHEPPPRTFTVSGTGRVVLDIRSDRQGEFFSIHATGQGTDVEVLDVQPSDRHLLVLVRTGGQKSKYLCGHDERHWFVAAVPESAPVGTVRAAKEALKPATVQDAQARHGLRARARNRRKNAAYRRQGEWFFIPAPGLKVDARLVLRDEPISRGNRSKPHWVDLCYRIGGQAVYVCSRHPSGVTEHQYQRIVSDNPEAKRWGWRLMRRNAEVYVRGRVRHADHAAITLHGWHRVVMNTENQSRAMANVAFLD
jgi:hypothetical protein